MDNLAGTKSMKKKENTRRASKKQSTCEKVAEKGEELPEDEETSAEIYRNVVPSPWKVTTSAEPCQRQNMDDGLKTVK